MRKLLLSLFLFCCVMNFAFAQDRTVNGTITSAEDGLPLPGASITLKGTKTATLTNSSGKFTIKISGSNPVLVIGFIGSLSQELPVPASNILNVALKPDAKNLSEVVVVAYGIATKESLTGSVSGITAKDLAKRPISNAVGALEGAAPGIQINNTAGQPGAEPEIRIRGFTSPSTLERANRPLYVVDGVPYNGNISDLNPADIESISVLKDAASSALYGSRAANGVVIVTTKKGTSNAGNVNLSVNQGIFSRGIKEYDRLNPNEFMETMWTGFRNNLRSTNPTTYSTDALAGARASSNLISDYLKLNIYNKADGELFDANGKLVADATILPGYANDLDWFKDIERLGHRQDYTLSARTATEKSNLYYSLGYLNEKGYIENSDYKRFTGRINADLKVNDWFKYGLNLTGSHQNSNLLPATASNATSIVNPFYFSRNIAPIYPVHLHDTQTGEYVLDSFGEIQFDEGSNTRNQLPGRHAIWENQLNMDRTVRNTLAGQAYADVKFLNDFNFTFKGDMNLISTDENTYNSAVIGDGAGNGGRASQESYRYKIYTMQQLLTWTKRIGLHNIDVLAGHENYSENRVYTYGYKTKETFANQTNLINFSEITTLTGDTRDYRTEGFFSRARYNYDGKYYFDASLRRDGSSKFAKGSQWGTFWSVGGSWIVSKEDFFAPLSNQINNLKLRASYGTVGSDVVAPYFAGPDLYDLDQNANNAAIYVSQNGNPALKWETSASVGIALEGRIFNRANFSVEYFDKSSKDLLYNVNLALSNGATSNSTAEATIARNLGTVSNRGIEVAFDVDVVRNNGFTWNVGANATWMKNKIVTLPEQNRANGIITSNNLFKYSEGHGIYDYWMPQFAGVDQMTGNALYIADTENYNVNGSAPDKTASPTANLVEIGGRYYTTNATYGKRDWSGSAMPDVFGSFSTSVSYKSFTLSGLFTYGLGGKTFDFSYQSLMTMSGSVSALHTDILKAWNGVPAGMTAESANRIDPNGVPVVDFSKSTLTNVLSTQYLQDGSYGVIKNISVAYQLPKELIKRFDMNSVRVNVGIENLATFTKLQGMNPQQSFGGTSRNAYVTPRMISFGLNIGL